MDFFSETPLCEEFEGLTMEECKQKLEQFTFSNFIKTFKVTEFLKKHFKIPRAPTMRYVYLYYLFKRIGPYIGDETVEQIFTEHIKKHLKDDIKRVLSLGEIYGICDRFSPHTQCMISLAIESITRGQHSNVLWEVLRDGVISSSKFYNAVKHQSMSKKLFRPWPIENDYYFASPLAFGLRCEETVKFALKEFVCKKKPVLIDIGFLQSPVDGIFGVSLDMCDNVYVDEKNMLQFKGDDIGLYEIKCRFKYKFSKIESDPIFLKYKQFYNNPEKQTLIQFINSIGRPAVEYVPFGKLPSKNDYLLTFDKDWDINPKRKRNLGDSHKSIYDCLRVNQYVSSKVLLLSDPAETGGKIDIKASLDANLFINSEHSYFYQILLQYKVALTCIQHHSSSGFTRLRNFIVSGFFRNRNYSDPVKCTIGDHILDCSVELPVLLIVTPVFIPSEVATESLSKAAKFWSLTAEEEFVSAPWVSSSLFADGSMTP
nr:deoxyribonuclease [Macronycteris gammaherpesvirus 1]